MIECDYEWSETKTVRKHKQDACACTHTRPRIGKTRPDWVLTKRQEIGTLQIWKEEDGKKLDNNGQYATFQTKYWQKGR